MKINLSSNTKQLSMIFLFCILLMIWSAYDNNISQSIGSPFRGAIYLADPILGVLLFGCFVQWVDTYEGKFAKAKVPLIVTVAFSLGMFLGLMLMEFSGSFQLSALVCISYVLSYKLGFYLSEDFFGKKRESTWFDKLIFWYKKS